MRSTAETISQTVRNMLAIMVSEDRDKLRNNTPRQVYSLRLKDLARHLNVTATYMPRKIKDAVWTIEDLDRLASYFDLYPADFVPGPGDEKTETE